MEKSLYSREYETLVRLLREARHERGLTQVELAALLDEPQPFVSRYECGGRRLDYVEVWRICETIGIPFDQLTQRFLAAVAVDE